MTTVPPPPAAGYPPAGMGKRMLAYVIDLAIVLVVAAAVFALTRSVVLTAVVAFEVVVAFVIWEGHAGATPGLLALGIRTVRAGTPVTVGVIRLLPRQLMFGASHLLGLGQFLLLGTAAGDMRGRQQAWHDLISDAQVIDVRAIRRAESSGAPGRVADLSAYIPPVTAAAPAAASPAVGDVMSRRAAAQQTPLAPPAAPAAVAQPIPQATPEPTPPRAPSPQPEAPSASADRGVEAATVAPPLVQPAAALLAFRLEDGQIVPIDRAGYIGRSPRAPEGAPRDSLLVTVPDPDRSMSRTHARFGVSAGTLWFEDLGSGNGSMLRLADGRSGPLTPHQRITVQPGMRIFLGDRTVEVVTNAD
ncbi:FHA domain-containing protein [Microbacterium marinilacus]|uniref:FHA domain-containing protein n=1 Tax=Microbacterium marinilacus TaxID=415209 RepID=A0ABP7BHC8_9MICO|nr:FHA domain-containing protein [Microbacterium marinilacus]MBY0689515.1 FHA domain-containing protein [Microbacterium marinilacus]